MIRRVSSLALSSSRLPGHFQLSSKAFAAKTTANIKTKVLAAADGVPGAQRPVAVFFNNGKTNAEGPAAGSYEKTRRRTQAGAHLVFNAFWLVWTFCLSQSSLRCTCVVPCTKLIMESSFTLCVQFCAFLWWVIRSKT